MILTDPMQVTPGRTAFDEALRLLRSEGTNVIAVLSDYTAEDAQFDTVICIREQPDLGLNTDHLVLDALREITSKWSTKVHG